MTYRPGGDLRCRTEREGKGKALPTRDDAPETHKGRKENNNRSNARCIIVAKAKKKSLKNQEV